MFRTLSKIFLIILSGVIFTSCADAKVLSKDFINKQVTSQLNQQMKSSVKGELKTEIMPLYLNDTVVPDGETKIKAYFKDRVFSPRKIATVDIIVNGKTEKKLKINLKCLNYLAKKINWNISVKRFCPETVATGKPMPPGYILNLYSERPLFGIKIWRE